MGADKADRRIVPSQSSHSNSRSEITTVSPPFMPLRFSSSMTPRSLRTFWKKAKESGDDMVTF